LVETATGGRPEDLGLRCIQLQPVWTHPRGDIVDADGDAIQ